MSLYVLLDSKILSTCEDYTQNKISSKDISVLFAQIAEQIVSFEDRELQEFISSVPATLDILWYANSMDIEETKEGWEEIRKDLLRYIDKIEKLIIRNSTKGEPITEEEREEWWKKQKEREQEEFYNRNGYYEDG